MGAGGPAVRDGSHIKLGRQGISHGHREVKYGSIQRFAPPVDGKQGQFTMVDALLGGVLDPDPPPVFVKRDSSALQRRLRTSGVGVSCISRKRRGDGVMAA